MGRGGHGQFTTEISITKEGGGVSKIFWSWCVLGWIDHARAQNTYACDPESLRIFQAVMNKELGIPIPNLWGREGSILVGALVRGNPLTEGPEP